jgi:predicted dehydrogenase
VRIGIIGAGNFTEKVFESFQTWENITFVGGYDVPAYTGLDVFVDVDDFMQCVDTVLVLDIMASNYSTLVEVVKNGKNLYIESLSLCSTRDLKKLEMLAYESGSYIQIGLKHRFYGFFSDLEKYNILPRILESSRFTKFNKKSTHLSVIDDLMLHDIDVTLKLANAEVKSIYSTAVGVYYEDPDVVNTRIEFYNGCVANLSASKISNKEVHQTKFFQNNTYCSIDYIEQLLKVQSNTGVDDEGCEEWGVKTTYRQTKDSDGYVTMLQKEINSFYNCIANKIEPIAGISQYLQLQSVTDKIKEQLERNFTTNA